ncbi:capsule polysaccharide biosynthesis protein [Acetobacteraceae bacterium AT-5844]|nr:capsule polysaccharide biosynthesis protein [Acetobacteraceae bacterium AT-5844]
MPIVDLDAIGFPSVADLSRAYFAGSLRDSVSKVFNEAHLCPEPLEYIRFFQMIMRPTWALPYTTRSSDFPKLRDGLLKVLEKANARIVLYPLHEAVKDENVIRLSWHTMGRKPQRWHYKVAYLPHMLHFDRDGYSGWSELYRTDRRVIQKIPAPLADSYFETLTKEYSEARISKYRQPQAAAIEAEDFVFVPLQLPNDGVIQLKLFPQPYLEGMGQAIASLLARGLRVVVKRHPNCRDKAVEQFLNSFDSPLFQVSKAAIHDLIPKSRCVVTLNSGVGFESLLYMRPVVCLGKADYSLAGKECADPTAIPEAVEAAIRELDPGFVLKVVFAAHNIYQLDIRSELASEQQVLRALCWNFIEKAER